MIASGLASLLGAGLFARWLARSEPGRAVPIALAGSAFFFLGEWALLGRAPRLAAAAVYLHVTAFGPLLLSGFWSVVNERFDPHSAKRNVSRLAGAAALAGVAGGLAVERVTALQGVSLTLGLLFVVTVAGAWALRGVGTSEGGEAADSGTARPEGSALGTLTGHPLLAPMSLLMVLGAAVDAFVDYALKAEAAAVWPETTDLVRFFAAFYVITGLLSFAVQVGLGTAVLRRFGIGAAMSLAPLAVFGSGLLALWSGRFWTVVLVRGVENVMANGLFRSGFELLYTPLPAAVRRSVKAWIDVSARSVGSIVGAGLVMFLLFVAPELESGVFIALAMSTSLFALLAIRSVDRAYVAELGSSLREGGLKLGSEEIQDATTARTVASGHAKIDRRSLLEEVRAYASEQEQREAAEPEASARSAFDPPTGAGEDTMAPDPVAERVAEIVSGDPLRVRRALHAREAGWSPALERRLIAHVAPLLGRPALAREAEGYLRRVAPRSQGQLVDGLLDRSEALPVRLALARILSSVPDVRAMMGLRLGLDDPDFAVRRACAEGCVRLVERRENLAPPKAEIHARMEREITALEAGQGGAASGDALEQIFSLLALLHGRDTARSTQTGVRSDNPRLRGTALEFLESVLPPGLWGRVSELIRSSD